jgi:hypothetical protein
LLLFDGLAACFEDDCCSDCRLLKPCGKFAVFVGSVSDSEQDEESESEEAYLDFGLILERGFGLDSLAVLLAGGFCCELVDVDVVDDNDDGGLDFLTVDFRSWTRQFKRKLLLASGSTAEEAFFCFLVLAIRPLLLMLLPSSLLLSLSLSSESSRMRRFFRVEETLFGFGMML